MFRIASLPMDRLERVWAWGRADSAMSWVWRPTTVDGVRNVVAGASAIDIKRGLDRATKAAIEALKALSRERFTVLVPGHGRPLDRDGLATWREGFDHLLACGASERPAAACVEGWLEDLGPLVPDAERPFASALLGHYVEAALRGEPSRTARLCGAREGAGRPAR